MPVPEGTFWALTVPLYSSHTIWGLKEGSAGAAGVLGVAAGVAGVAAGWAAEVVVVEVSAGVACGRAGVFELPVLHPVSAPRRMQPMANENLVLIVIIMN